MNEVRVLTSYLYICIGVNVHKGWQNMKITIKGKLVHYSKIHMSLILSAFVCKCSCNHLSSSSTFLIRLSDEEWSVFIIVNCL